MAIRLVVGSSVRKGEVRLCGKKVVELGHTGNDLVAVVRHDDGRLGCLSNNLAVDGGF